MTEAVVLINSFEVPAADADVFIAAWEKTRDRGGRCDGWG